MARLAVTSRRWRPSLHGSRPRWGRARHHDARGTLNTRLEQAKGLRLAMRIGMHTGTVVVGTLGSGGRHGPLALGETPNLAAQLQSLAAPDTVALGDTTDRRVHRP
jgi:class 3 adenylate cyclase